MCYFLQTGKFYLMTVLMLPCCCVHQSPCEESPDHTSIPVHYNSRCTLVPNRVFVGGLDYKVTSKLDQPD